MKLQKQEKALNIFEDSKKYYVSPGQGRLYSYRRNRNSWELVAGNKLKSGHIQHTLYGGRGTEDKITIYEHVLVWITTYGVYDEKLTIRHRDGVFSNNCAHNLYLDGLEDLGKRPTEKVVPRKIRKNEIEQIKALVIEGKTPTEISTEMHLDYNNVAYAVRKIRSGELMRFDKRNPGRGRLPTTNEPIFKLPEE